MTRRELKPVNYIAYGLNDILGAGSMAVISGAGGPFQLWC